MKFHIQGGGKAKFVFLKTGRAVQNQALEPGNLLLAQVGALRRHRVPGQEGGTVLAQGGLDHRDGRDLDVQVVGDVGLQADQQAVLMLRVGEIGDETDLEKPAQILGHGGPIVPLLLGEVDGFGVSPAPLLPKVVAVQGVALLQLRPGGPLQDLDGGEVGGDGLLLAGEVHGEGNGQRGQGRADDDDGDDFLA